MANHPKEKSVEARQTFTEPITGMEFIFIKGGCFALGDAVIDRIIDEKTNQNACVDDYYIGKYEVTQGQWKKIMDDNPSYFMGCGENCPVESVSWLDIQSYLAKLNTTGVGKYRLPTEVEWEYAAKNGGENKIYDAGDIEVIELITSYDKSWKTHPVGQRKPNELGLHDMFGNVWEWVQDWHEENYYRDIPKHNPRGPASGSRRVVRGSNWYCDADVYVLSFRASNTPDTRHNDLGFRLIRIK